MEQRRTDASLKQFTLTININPLTNILLLVIYMAWINPRTYMQTHTLTVVQGLAGTPPRVFVYKMMLILWDTMQKALLGASDVIQHGGFFHCSTIVFVFSRKFKVLLRKYAFQQLRM